MEAVLAKYENQINVFTELLEDEFPDSEVWILGESYHAKTEKSELQCDVGSRLWFTYRKKFSPIGGTGPSSDAGWGCMLRCGQMILAQALVCSHLGRNWRWISEESHPAEYQRILHCFLDRKDCCYSIHQMAQMGVGEGKAVGEWFGPNTVAQVLRKLTLFDDWSSLAVYVSMDHTVVIEDIKKQCHQEVRPAWCICGGVGVPPCGGCSDPEQLQAPCAVYQQNSQRSVDWRPLLLLIPLRMGINNINPIYIQALKECFKMPQSCGVLGGKPNLAFYFIGFIDDELIYLDPHTTQPAVDCDSEVGVDDQSYHLQRSPHRMKISSLDPSVALGFFCKTEDDFDDWCHQVQQEILKKKLRMFELVEKHPSHWPPFVPPTQPEVQTTGAEFIESTDNLFESEDEFEILTV